MGYGNHSVLLLSSCLRNISPYTNIPSLQKLSHRQHLTESQVLQSTHTHLLDIKTDYRVAFDFSADMRPTTITIEPLIKTLRSYKLACQTPEVCSLPSYSLLRLYWKYMCICHSPVKFTGCGRVTSRLLVAVVGMYSWFPVSESVYALWYAWTLQNASF